MAQKQEKQAGNQLALIKKDVVDVVSKKVNGFISRGELHLPPNYTPDNALKSAWLELQSIEDKDKKPALAVCTKDSIANALLDMVVQGLNPAKKQCYFVVYGDKLKLMRSYFGTAAVAKRALKLHNIFAEIVYEGDVFEYEIRGDMKRVTKHEQKLENIKPDKIIAAYCVITFPDSRPDYTEIMTIDQIKKSWAKSKADQTKPGSTHKEFPDQMAKRTVIARACKLAINMTGDEDLLIESFNRTSVIEDEEDAAEALELEAAECANRDYIDIEPDQEPEKELAGTLSDEEKAELDNANFDEDQESIFNGSEKGSEKGVK